MIASFTIEHLNYMETPCSPCANYNICCWICYVDNISNVRREFSLIINLCMDSLYFPLNIQCLVDVILVKMMFYGSAVPHAASRRPVTQRPCSEGCTLYSASVTAE